MIVAQYYKSTAEEIHKIIRSREPFIVSGMCESGKNLTYRQTQDLLLSSKVVANIFLIDLVGINLSNDQITIKQLGTTSSEKINSYELDSYIHNNYSLVETTILVNLSDNESEDDLPILKQLINLRSSLGTKFSFGLFSYVNLINQIKDNPSLDNLLSRKLIKLMPLDLNNSLTMIDRNEQLFSLRLSDSQKKNIHKLSGGNPGLIKTLVQHIFDEKNRTDTFFDDQQVIWRLNRIIEGLSEQQLEVLKQIAKGNKIKSDNQEISFLLNWGFLTADNKDIFSKLLEHFLKNTNKLANPNIILTATELKIYNFFQDNLNSLVSREQLAEIIWGHPLSNHTPIMQ